MNALQKLQGLKSLFNGSPEQIIGQAVGMLTPMLEKFIGQYNKPEEEGGLLQEGDVRILFAILPTEVRNPQTGDSVSLQLPCLVTLDGEHKITSKHTLQSLLKKEENGDSNQIETSSKAEAEAGSEGSNTEGAGTAEGNDA